MRVLLDEHLPIGFAAPLAHVGLGIVVLDAPSNKLPDLQARAKGALEAIAAVGKGQVLHVAG